MWYSSYNCLSVFLLQVLKEKRKCYQFYIFERDFQKIAKINSQQEKPVFSDPKISPRKTQENANPENETPAKI